MRICILSKDNIPLGYLDNDAPEALHFYDDNLHKYLDGNAHIFEFDVDSHHKDAELLSAGNKLSFRDGVKDYYLTIMTVAETEDEKSIEAFSLSFELNNESALAFKASAPMSFAEYIAAMNFEHRSLTIGRCEVSDKRITCEWESDSDTILSRIYSLADKFGAEVEFVPVLNDDYSLNTITLNVYVAHDDGNQGIGRRRDGYAFRYGRNISGVRRTVDVKELYTAIRPYGSETNGTRLTLESLGEIKIYDDNGILEFHHIAGAKEILAPKARDLFPSNVLENSDRYIAYNWNTEYKTVNDLYGNSLAKLKKLCVPSVEYEIDGYMDVDIGDTVIIADEGFNPPLYLEARVTEQQVSFTDPSKNKTTFNTVIELESQVSAAITSRMQELSKAVSDAQAAADQAREDAARAQAAADENSQYAFNITSSNGTVFKNSTGTTTLYANCLLRGQDISDDMTIVWMSGETEVGTGKTYTINAANISEKATFRFDAYDIDDILRGSAEVTVSDLTDASQIWTTTTAPKTPNYTFTIENLTGDYDVPVKTGDIILYSYYRYTVSSVSDTTVRCTTRQSLRGSQGAKGDDGEDAVLLRIDSSRGNMFKNNAVSTDLRVTIFYGAQTITTQAALIEAFGNTAHLEWYWQRVNEDEFHVISASDSRLYDDGFAFVLTPNDVDTKVTFICRLIID